MSQNHPDADKNSAAIQSSPLPASIISVVREIGPADPATWQPGSYTEWLNQERTRTFLSAWSAQADDERTLRRQWATWAFGLIALQVVAVFGLLVAQGLGALSLDLRLLQVVLPSVLSEVFGLGFLVAKYLFSQSVRHSLDGLALGIRDDRYENPSPLQR